MRQPVSSPRPLKLASRPSRLAAGLRATLAMGLIVCVSGCGLMGSGQQLKQLQVENDRLISEYRAQRERLAALQETNAALEARVGEAERLLAQVGKTLPSSRISRAPQRSTGTPSPSAPPYVPPSVSSVPDSTSDKPAAGEVQWRPMRRE